MNDELKHYQRISKIKSNDAEKPLMQVVENVSNEYYTEQLAEVPAGAQLLPEFGFDAGLYAVAGFDGVTHKVKIPVAEFHKLKFLDD